MSHIHCNVLFLTIRRQPSSTLFPYTTLFRSGSVTSLHGVPPAAQPVLHGRLHALGFGKDSTAGHWERSEEHTSELQSHSELVCRLLLEKKHSVKEWHEHHPT